MKQTISQLVFLFIISVSAVAQPGSNDASFNPTDIGLGYGDGLDGYGQALAIQPDGKIFVGGNYTSANSKPRKYLARYNANGTLDNSFDATGDGLYGQVFALRMQTDGKLIVGGTFT